MGRTIKAKILIFSCTLLMTVVICQIIFSVFLSKSYYTNLKKTQVETLFFDLKKNYSDDINTIRRITRYAESAYNINVQIFSDAAMIYWNGGIDFLPPYSQIELYSDDPKAAIVSAPEIPIMTNLFGMTSDNIMLLGRFGYNNETRYVRLTMSVESIDASVTALTKVNLFISCFILVAGIIWALIFAKKFSKPILNIQDVARNVAMLNFNFRANENLSVSELRDLSKNINIMADKLTNLISDLRSSNEQLQADVNNKIRLEKMRREFVANVSHELKTPLHLLLMYTEILKSNIDDIDKDYYCDTIIEETNRMNDMVKNLLDLSAIENGLAKMSMDKFDLSGFLDYVMSKMSVMLETFDVSVNLEKDVYVTGDEQYLEQAVRNFITNAISHTQPGGKILITLKLWNNNAIFSVINEGNHIGDEDLSQIWESFYKTDKARAITEENHSGLGLYVVKTIIEAHNGNYGVRNVDNGVVFWFSLTAMTG